MPQQNNNKLHDTAALRALTSEKIAESPIDTPKPCEGHVVNLDSQDIAGMDLSQTTTLKREMQAKFAYKRTHAIGVQFRKITIPALLGVSIILWTIGGLTIWMKNHTPLEMVKKNQLLVNAELFMWICVIIGLALSGGAIFFIIELKKLQQKGEQ